MEKLFCGYRDFGDNGRMVFETPGGKGPDVLTGGPEAGREEGKGEGKPVRDRAGDVVGAGQRRLDSVRKPKDEYEANWANKKKVEGPGGFLAKVTYDLRGRNVNFRTEENGRAEDVLKRGTRLQVVDPIERYEVFGAKFIKVINTNTGNHGYVAENLLEGIKERAKVLAKQREFKDRGEFQGELERGLEMHDNAMYRQVLDAKLKAQFPNDKAEQDKRYAAWDNGGKVEKLWNARGNIIWKGDRPEFEKRINVLYKKVLGDQQADIFADRLALKIATAAESLENAHTVFDIHPGETLDTALDAMAQDIFQYYKIQGVDPAKRADFIKDMFNVTDLALLCVAGERVVFDYGKGTLTIIGQDGKLFVEPSLPSRGRYGDVLASRVNEIQEKKEMIRVSGKPVEALRSTLAALQGVVPVDLDQAAQERVRAKRQKAQAERFAARQAAAAKESGVATLERGKEAATGDLVYTATGNISVIDLAREYYGQDVNAEWILANMPARADGSFVYASREQVKLPKKLSERDRIKDIT